MRIEEVNINEDGSGDMTVNGMSGETAGMNLTLHTVDFGKTWSP
jgi:hypothetical protein